MPRTNSTMAHSNLQVIKERINSNHASVGNLPKSLKPQTTRNGVDESTDSTYLVKSSEQTIK